MGVCYELVIVLCCSYQALCSDTSAEKVGVLEASSRAVLTQAHEFLSKGKRDLIEKSPESSHGNDISGPDQFSDCSATVWAGTQTRAEVEGNVPAGQDRILRSQANGQCLFAIFDGHGEFGHVISEAAREKIEERFLSNKMSNALDIEFSLDAVSKSIQDIPEAKLSGSTGAGVISSTSGPLLVFHLGDSQVLWATDDGSVLGHSADHNCDNWEEAAQLRDPCFKRRMICDRDTDGNLLAADYVRLSMILRAFGDMGCHSARKDGHYSKAAVQTVPRSNVKWLLVGSDGVFGPLRSLSDSSNTSQSLTQLTSRPDPPSQSTSRHLTIDISTRPPHERTHEGTNASGTSSRPHTNTALQYLLESDDESRVQQIKRMLDLGSHLGSHSLTINGQAVPYFGTGDDQSIITVRFEHVQTEYMPQQPAAQLTSLVDLKKPLDSFVGALISIFGLQKEKELNGRFGKVQSLDPSGRLLILLEPGFQSILVKPENLHLHLMKF